MSSSICYKMIESILASLSDYAALRYTNVAFLMLLIYDHIITFGDEVSRIWPLPWQLPKVSFLVNRYLIPPMLLFNGLTPSIRLKHNMYA
ncbi:hypothetical protein E4T56_gene13796 [Termitomyces sp. T112]|nr:hypothetical protein E4T56_gene13796 [Termitomyces sp. T112]